MLIHEMPIDRNKSKNGNGYGIPCLPTGRHQTLNEKLLTDEII
jgi:hypothetical protein